MYFIILVLWCCFPLQCGGQLLPSSPQWQQQVFPTPLTPRSGSSGLVVNLTYLSFIGGVPSAAALTDTCIVDNGIPPALATVLSLSASAPLGSTATLRAPEAPLSTPLTLASAAAAHAPTSSAGRLVTFSSVSSDVLLWEAGAASPVVCPAPDLPRPLPRASAGLVWLRACNPTFSGGSTPQPCFLLYGGVLSGGALAGDLWYLFGAEAPLPGPLACSWQQVPPSALNGDSLPPLSQFSFVATPAQTEAVLYGGALQGGGASASVFRIAPYGFADANADTEMNNIALPRDGLVPFAWQSSLPRASRNWGGFPSRAIDNARYADGNIKTGYWDNSCTHTEVGDVNPWWGVDLGASQSIHALRMYQRTDCCIGRFAGMAVYFSNLNGSALVPGGSPWALDGWALPLTNPNLLTAAVLFPVPANTTARYVWVTLPGSNRLLTLCEVQVLQRKPMAVRNLALPLNVALNAPTFGPFTNVGNAGGGQLLPNAVDGVNTAAASIRNGNSYVQVNGPTGATAATNVAATPYVGIDLGKSYALSAITLFPSNQPAANTRISVYAGATRDYNYMQRCWGPGDIGAGVTGGGLGTGGSITLPSCAGLTARYVALARSLVNNPLPGDSNNLWVNEVQVLAAAQGSIPSMARYGAASARWGGHLWVFGGLDGVTGSLLGDLQVFDLGSFTWLGSPPTAILGSPPPARAFAALTTLPPTTSQVGNRGLTIVGTSAPTNGLALFGGSGQAGDTGDLTLLTFPPAPP